MFKLESYIAPILLSYVDKYIKNFRLEDSQVSLWGGDATFQNLDLRLEVLEQELQSPFSFISGHIRELSIHVPWTKLTSEPITITINTIECVLKLKDANDGAVTDASPTKEKPKKQEGEAPPNYVQLLINKIVSNIRIFCNNLILKYVEEDIVLSMNVKHLKVESCNEKWEAAYTDVSPTQVIMRKIIGVNDLTVCLDRRNSSGKIDVYQEPMLYRCSMTMHFLRTYHAATATETSLTRLDVYCNNMEFSMTEQQIPMFIRLILLQQKQMKPMQDQQENAGASTDNKESLNTSQSWTGWAWSYVSSVLPTQWEEDQENSNLIHQSGHVVQVGLYVDNASLTFKLSETTSDKSYYNQKKIRYHPLLALRLQGIYSEMVSVGRKWFNIQFGISETVLLPLGACSCSHPESEALPYMQIGSKTSSHKSNSLFDAEAVENAGQNQYRNYNTNWDFHMFTNTESVLLERTPAFACDYVYQIEAPDDTTSDILSDLGTNLEYSDMAEKASLRAGCGPLKFRVCSGFFHRIGSLKVAATSYDYSPCYVPKADPSLQELLPPSEDDFDALNEFIPIKSIKFMIFSPLIELQYMDHSYFEPTKQALFRKATKLKKGYPSNVPCVVLEKLPKITVECKSIEIGVINPMYINRLVHTTCQLPDPPKKMFEACFSRQDINIVGLASRLILRQNHHTTIVVPFNLSFQSKSILKPQYWTNPDTVHEEINFQSDNLTFNCTKPKLIVVSYLIDDMLKRKADALQNLRATTLLFDATKDFDMPYLELYVEGVRFRKICANSTISVDVALGSVKAFIFESLGRNSSSLSEKINENSSIQQVMFLSGPEPKSSRKKSISSFSEDLPLFTATVQYPLKPESQPHPSLLIFNLQEIKVCVDPLVCKWLLYLPVDIGIVNKSEDRFSLMKSKSFPPDTVNRRISTTQIESVHSSSDREHLVMNQNKLVTIEEEETADVQEQVYNFFKTWHPVWKSMLLSGHISQCVIYFPMASISAIGSQGVEEAMKEALKKKLMPNVMVITLPFANIYSAQKQNVVKYLKHLPVKLPETIWNVERSSFPWTMSISDLNCYSMENGKEIEFIKTVSLSATVGLSTRNASDTSAMEFKNSPSNTASNNSSGPSIGSLGVYVHIDITPIIISVSETQMYLLASLIYGLNEFFSSLRPRKRGTLHKQKSVATEDLPQQVTNNTFVSPSLSPTQKDDNTSETIQGTGADKTESAESDENIKLTAWIQWTITKFSVELLSHDIDNKNELKLVVDVEDIVSSLDYQSVYLKLKSKIGSIAIQHYKRNNDNSKWQAGAFSGVVMRLREDVPLEKRPEESGFIGITITRASSQHTHNLWGAPQKKSSPKDKISVASSFFNISTSKFITEIVVSVQPIDCILSIKTLMAFYTIVAPFIEGITNVDVKENKDKKTAKSAPSFTNQSLPLAYLECHEFRIIIPSADFVGRPPNHDVFVLQVTKVSLSPSVVNPICRKPLRPDIYRQAVQARVLSVPGSELEDRQYQLDIVGMAVSTSTWRDLDQVLNVRGSVISGINENPALEWNNLEQGQLGLIPMLNLKQITDKFDISIVAAPAMIYKNDVTVCSSSFEINFVSDISIFLSLDQIKLSTAIVNELTLRTVEKIRPEITYPYSRFDMASDDNELTEFYRDSGIDCDIKSMISVISSKQSFHNEDEKSIISKPPQIYGTESMFEVLFTAGKINCCLYQVYISQSVKGKHRGKKKKSFVDDEDRDYEASEEESIDKTMKIHKKYIPLVYLFIRQPNAYFSSQQFSVNAHLSCFDLGVKLTDYKSKPLSSVPKVEDFQADFITTRSGIPDPVTGIPPAFLTLKYRKELGRNANVYIDLSRPTKIIISSYKLLNLTSLRGKIVKSLYLLEKFFESEYLPARKTPEETSSFRFFKENLKGIDMVEFKTDQLVFVHEDESENLQANLIFGKIKSRMFSHERPEKINNFTTLDAVTFSVSHNNVTSLILKPWTVSAEVNAFLESWQAIGSDPQIQITIDSDNILVELSAHHLYYLNKIIKKASELSTCFPKSESQSVSIEAIKLPSISPQPITNNQDKDQHYKDDLRAGAFQVIESSSNTGDELPLPYQIMFWNSQELSAMAWKYPQPRALTKVRIFPVPFEILPDSGIILVKCDLQYWCDHHGAYISYAQFSLSESEICYLDLPKTEPLRAVAYVWRVVLKTFDEYGEEVEKNSISPRALAACMRIDSYFNKNLIPDLTCVVHISKLELSLCSNLKQDSANIFPVCLKRFTYSEGLDSHSFLKVTAENVHSHMGSWKFESFSFDLYCASKCSVIEYGFLTEQTIIEQFSSKLEINLAKKMRCSFISSPIQLILGPTVTHTLTVNAQLWNENYKSLEKRDSEFVIFTRYVLCNDTDLKLRYGQVSTDEDLLLGSRSFNLYSWWSLKQERKLKLALQDKAGWIWSQPFKIDEEGLQAVELNTENNLNVIITVKSISATQKQIIIGGQFVIANMLLEHFEFKILTNSKDDKELKKAPLHILNGKTITPSMFLDYTMTYYLRLRFFGLETAWTGDIPLQEHTKGAQPWLVKVPLQERGQFLSIWCKIVVEDYQDGKRILAMLWPLFMVKSNLPVSAKLHIETPTLNVHLDSIVSAKGEMQQLYCPGTIDHSHHLTFRLHDGTSISDPYIPLNYSLVDQQKFFKKSDKENIDEIIESLSTFDKSTWPYFGDNFENVDWIVEEQPQTVIQVRYRNACPYSSALLVELLPWCLIVNTFGSAISLVINGRELCRIPQYGVVAPPTLDDNFHLGVDIGSGWSYSGPLQLATSDWSQAFYMPKISGTLPADGGIRAVIKKGSDICMVAITSGMSNEIRLLKISSTHVFSNYLSNQIQVVCFAVPENDKLYDVPPNIENVAFSVGPHGDKTNSGISIIRWYCLDSDICDLNTNYVLYMSFSLQHGWSCPVRVDETVARRSLSVGAPGKKSVPLVLIAQERKGQMYLSLYQDEQPQTLIKNKSAVNLYCAQSVVESNNVATESQHFNWFTKLEFGASTYYTMPFVSEKFPELPQTCFAEKIVFAIKPKRGQSYEWSSPISITSDLEQFVKIPEFGDVNVIVKITTFSTLLTVESVSQVEISALDIRGRLSRHEIESSSRKSVNSKDSNNIENLPSTSAPEIPDASRVIRDLSKISLYNSLFVPTIPTSSEWEIVEITSFIKSFTVMFLADQETDLERRGVASFTFDAIGIEMHQSTSLAVSVWISDMQFDNQLYAKQSYDFPVVLVSQNSKSVDVKNVLSVAVSDLIEISKEDALSYINLNMETWKDDVRNIQSTGVKEVKISINPLSFYIEDLYINKMVDYFNKLLPQKPIIWTDFEIKTPGSKSVHVKIPEIVFWESSLTARPLIVKNITIEPLSLLLSVHCSLKMYIALDQSPLQFAKFERRRLLTTPYRLGHAMTMHYLSGAIFGAGWVVSSLELLGSPSGLARAMGTGLRDFINMPYRGFVQGPWAFIYGISNGSASLMRHMTAGTLQSVTKLASSVARNLDRLTLDEEHLRRTEEQRRQKPQGVTEGFMLGMTGLGISLLGAVGGIAHHPLQSIWADGASPRSLAAGLGLGLVGVFTKPLSGAAELVALTGQGLLQGAGWNPLPELKIAQIEENSYSVVMSDLKYDWKFIHGLSYKNILYAIEATIFINSNLREMTAVALILTTDALIVLNLDDDVISRAISFNQLQILPLDDNDPTLVQFKIITNANNKVDNPVEDPRTVLEMDPACRARVADYVRSTASLLQIPDHVTSEQHSEIKALEEVNEMLSCYVNPQNRNYFVSVFALAKQSGNSYIFPVL